MGSDLVGFLGEMASAHAQRNPRRAVHSHLCGVVCLQRAVALLLVCDQPSDDHLDPRNRDRHRLHVPLDRHMAARACTSLGWFHAPDHTGLVGAAMLAFTLGLRHAFDADQIAAIDNECSDDQVQACEATLVVLRQPHRVTRALPIWGAV